MTAARSYSLLPAQLFRVSCCKQITTTHPKEQEYKFVCASRARLIAIYNKLSLGPVSVHLTQIQVSQSKFKNSRTGKFQDIWEGLQTRLHSFKIKQSNKRSELVNFKVLPVVKSAGFPDVLGCTMHLFF